jgi:hypothetical protein
MADPEPDHAHVAASAQEGLDPRRQFANIERFDQKVVAAGFQSRDSFLDGSESADHQGGRPPSFAAQGFDDRTSVLAVQEPIDDHDTHVARTSRPKPLGQSLRNLDCVTASRHIEANFLGEFAIVFDEENETAGSRLWPFVSEYT